MNLDFSDAQFELDEELHPPTYSKEFMAQKRDEMKHVKKFEQIKQKLPIKVISRPSSAHSHKDESISRHQSYLKKKSKASAGYNSLMKPNNMTEPFPNTKTPSQKSVKFSNVYFNQNTPVIRQEYSDQSDAAAKLLQKQSKKPQSKALDWDDGDIDDHFFIKHESIQSERRNPIEIKNQQILLSKLNTLKPAVMTPQSKKIPTGSSKSSIQAHNKIVIQKTDAITPYQIIAQQLKQIQTKQAQIQQLKMNEIIKNKLVVSTVPKASDDEYENEKFEDKDQNQAQDFEPTISQHQQPQQITKNESHYSLKKPESQNKLITDNKSQTSKNTIQMNPDQIGYTSEITRPEIKAYNRQQKLQITEDQLLLKNPVIQSQFKIWKENEEKERTMLDIQNKRREQLAQAQQTLKSLEEQMREQKQIIETLSRKEQYSLQIIEHLKIKTNEHSKLYSSKLRQIQAGAVILHWLRMFRDKQRLKKLKSERQL